MRDKKKVRKPREIIKKRRLADIISRKDWGAKEPKYREPLQLPAFNVLIKFYTDTPPCTNREECEESMRHLQDKYLREGLPDLPYNFCIGGDDQIYEGRGWFTASTKVDGEMPQWEGTSLDIAYIGQRFPGKNLTPPVHDLLEMGINKKCIVGMFYFEILTGIEEVPDRLKDWLKVED